MTRHLEDSWLDYLRMVVPVGADQVQISETRRAFFAGAQTMYAALAVHPRADLLAEMEQFLTEFKARHGLG